jgi:NADPH:quinone reductase-like Zn-dependent oxidoreductase
VASQSQESFLRKLGADEFIDYTKSRPEEVAHDVDLVLDTVGGPGSSRFLRTLKRGGALYPVFVAEHDPEETAKLGVTTSGTQVRSNGPQLAELGRLLDAGTLRTAIDSTFRLRMPKGARPSRPWAPPRQDRAHGRVSNRSRHQENLDDNDQRAERPELA